MAAQDASGLNADQIKHWNEVSGPKWVALDNLITSGIRPLGEVALARADVKAGERVLDVGCGCGETSIAAARLVGPTGSVLGLDVSAPMLERAREAARAAGALNVRFEEADAQTVALPERTQDVLYSRFGVMFFGDPEAAFTNLRRALRPGGRMSFVCWRELAENPWMLVPAMAAMQHFPIPPPDPSAPGPFAFADSGKVRGILERAGFVDVAFEPVDRELFVAGEGADFDQVVSFAMAMGPTGAAAQKASPEARSAAAQAVREALRPFQTAEGVRMASGSWVVTAASP